MTTKQHPIAPTKTPLAFKRLRRKLRPESDIETCGTSMRQSSKADDEGDDESHDEDTMSCDRSCDDRQLSPLDPNCPGKSTSLTYHTHKHTHTHTYTQHLTSYLCDSYDQHAATENQFYLTILCQYIHAIQIDCNNAPLRASRCEAAVLYVCGTQTAYEPVDP